MARKLIPPTRAEDKRINRGIANDPDTFEATAKDFARAKPARDVLPAGLMKSIHETAEEFHAAGIMDERTMREFDDLSLTSGRRSSPKKFASPVKRPRKGAT